MMANSASSESGSGVNKNGFRRIGKLTARHDVACKHFEEIIEKGFYKVIIVINYSLL
jgi:hypothetical protein